MRLAVLMGDVLLISAVYLATIAVRFDFAVPPRYWSAVTSLLPVILGVHIMANWAFNLYREIWPHAGIRQAVRIGLASVASGAFLLALSTAIGSDVPASVLVFGPVLAAVALTALRFRDRLIASTIPRSTRRGGIRVVVVGAGDGGGAIVREIQRKRIRGLVPVAIVDDDPHKKGRSVSGVKVLGPLDTLGQTIVEKRAEQVLLAIPSADQEVVRQVAATCESSHVPLKVLPPVQELLSGRISLDDVRDLGIEDLVGRRQAAIDTEGVRDLVQGRRVLVTGAGGSIGSEIARQLSGLDPSALILLDRDETLLHDVASLLGRTKVTTVLADVRDQSWISAHLRDLRPEVVFHAAAHKHVPVLEEYPAEAFLTNVVGTKNVLDAALDVGAIRFVLISTDKAVRPSSVMGASKRLAEHVVLSRATAGTSHLCAVRFGNVLGSRGSVVPTFARQIKAGGPVTVTHPAMTRFFLSTTEAVQLVMQAAVMTGDRDVFMLDMGEPANILDLAKRMIRLAGKVPEVEVPIELTGIRPGEKLVEELSAPGEDISDTIHPAIRRLTTPVMSAAEVDELVEELLLAVGRCDGDAVAAGLHSVSGVDARRAGRPTQS